MIGIVPSTIAADHTRLGEHIREAELAGADRIQIDVMDGHFVPAITTGPLIVEAVRRCTRLPLEAHLMISHPERSIGDFVRAGADIIIVHQESSPHLHRLIQQIKAAGKMAGVALNPATPALLLEDVLPLLDMVLVMTINPGFEKQEFLPETLPKIARLRQMISERALTCDIEVDGRIQENTARQVVQAGANLLVAGSAVFNKRESVAEAIERLRRACR
ncbi:MAG: ribulose-phosphate 3-epimerase [Ktedonobacteraceae bacterium]|nr:ribulose-phosphate 3-epimerase [Ktedonobacteraceae bacterium]